MATPPPTALPLRVRGPAGGQPALLSDLTSASTLAELEAAARAALGIREGAAVALLAGFPPRRLGEGGDADAAAIALGSLGLRANEVVTAKEETGAAATVLQGQGAMPGGKRGKKAAGGAGSKRPAAAVAAVGGGGPNIHTLHGRASGSGSARSGGGGGGGGGKRRRAADVGKEQEDIAEVLALAASGGGGQHGAQLRAVFRRAVEHQFNEAKAAARVAAVAAGPTHYEIEESQEARRTDGSAARLKVKYHKGVGFRSAHEDDVELMSKATLAATVAMVLADTGEFTREMLKPEYMAGVSPRIFWSMVHHFGPDIEAALRQLLPAHTDWAFLHEKTRKLSEKALANQAQAEEDRRAKAAAAAEKKARREARLARGQKGKGEGGEADGDGGRGEGAAVAASEGAAAAVVDVEGEDEGGATAAAAAAGAAAEAEERERRAQAALARLGGGGGGEQAATAVGGDGKAGGGEDAGEESEVDSDFPEIVTDAWVKVFRQPPFNITCCKELAGVSIEALHTQLQEHHASGAPPRLPSLPDEDTLDSWVNDCRSDELDEMMLTIVGGDDAVVDALAVLDITWPQDVKLWALVPQSLLSALRRELPEEQWAALEGRVTAGVIVDWAARAQHFEDTVWWLCLYSAA